ncbi:hypothetical protein ACYRFS_12785 [Listeria kieliensis]
MFYIISIILICIVGLITYKNYRIKQNRKWLGRFLEVEIYGDQPFLFAYQKEQTDRGKQFVVTCFLNDQKVKYETIEVTDHELFQFKMDWKRENTIGKLEQKNIKKIR